MLKYGVIMSIPIYTSYDPELNQDAVYYKSTAGNAAASSQNNNDLKPGEIGGLLTNFIGFVATFIILCALMSSDISRGWDVKNIIGITIAICIVNAFIVCPIVGVIEVYVTKAPISYKQAAKNGLRGACKCLCILCA